MYYNENLHNRRRMLRQKSQAAAAPQPNTHIDDEPFDMTRLSLKRRLALIEALVAAHPGRAISLALLDLFPELRQIP